MADARPLPFENPRRPREAWVPLLAGLVWLLSGAAAGTGSLLVSVVPGALMLAAGVAQLLWAGDPRIFQFGALGSGLGVLVCLPLAFGVGLLTALGLGVLAAASFVALGVGSVRQVDRFERVPAPRPSTGLAAKVAVDELALGFMQVSIALPRGDVESRIAREVIAARELFEARGWLEKPVSYHITPLPLDAPQIDDRRFRGIEYEHLRFESEYEPRPEEPGRERWLGYRANRTAHAWVVRHAGPPRPWLVCINGFMMGTPLVDLGVFDPRVFHEKLGLNLAMPVLPLHGPRRRGRISGNGFLSGDVLDTVHAEAQAMWDIRRVISWVREQGAPGVGVYGLSLGGYTASLLAGLEEDLDCVIAGIPLVDISRIFWHHGPPLILRNLEQHISQRDVESVLRVVSPLALPPLLPRSRRAIFAAVVDRLVPPDQARDLHDHWEQPRIDWFQGSHCTFLREPSVRACIRESLDEAGLIA